MSQLEKTSEQAIAQLLADRMSAVNLDAAAQRIEEPASDHARHLLLFDYPACQLLPSTSHFPQLFPPFDVAVMDAPPDDKRVLGITETDFFAELPVKTVQPHYYPSSEPYLDLLTAVECVASAAGTSALRIVRFWDDARQGFYFRFRLEILNEDDSRTTVKDVELDPRQMGLIAGCGSHYSWILTMQYLIARNSYRAIYHARERIAKFYGCSSGAVELEEAMWPFAWGSAMGAQSVDQEAHPNVTEMKACSEFVEADAMWRPLDADPRRYDVLMDNFHSMTVFRALHVALSSLAAPRFLSPESLTFVSHPYTKLVLETFEAYLYYYDEYFIAVTPNELWEDLYKQILKTRLDTKSDFTLGDSEIPPGYQPFLAKWLTRAVNFMMERRCSSQEGSLHAGVHKHGELVYYNPGEWDDQLSNEELRDRSQGYCGQYDWYGDDEEGPKRPATLQDVETMMKNASLSREE